jgi:hypothetical protein
MSFSDSVRSGARSSLVILGLFSTALCACQGDDNTLPLPVDASATDAHSDSSAPHEGGSEAAADATGAETTDAGDGAAAPASDGSATEGGDAGSPAEAGAATDAGPEAGAATDAGPEAADD